MTLSELYHEFIYEKQLAGLSKASIVTYQNILQLFVAYVGPESAIENLTYNRVGDYIFRLLERPLSRATKSTYVRNIRIFLCWIQREYGLSFDPKRIRIPKSPKKVVHILSSAEIMELFRASTSHIPWISSRNRSIIALMLDSGLRQKEVCALMRRDIDFDRNVLKVTGKGAKDRLVPLGSFSKMILQNYLAQCPYSDVPYVFCDRMGAQLSRNAIKIFMNRLKHKLSFDVTSHKLRHNFATNFCVDNYRRTGNTGVYDLCILMGHESMETTKKYEHFAHELLALERANSHLDELYHGCWIQ